MPKKYTCVSRNARGERITALMEAETRQELLFQLKEQGLTAVEIQEQGAHAPEGKEKRKFFSWPRFSPRGVSTSDLAVFWREFATMVSAGLPIVDALQSITEELDHARFRAALQDVTAHIWEGFNLSDSLKKHPRIFSPMTAALIGAAEESGSLPEVAQQLANYLENRDRLIRKVQAALAYPIFLTGFFFVVLIVATFWIIPKFREIYTTFNAELPWLTEKVFAINSFMLSHFAWIVAGFAALALAVAFWARRPGVREQLDRWSFKIPIFGTLLQRAAVARFCRSLAILLAGGIPINRGLEMAQETCGNLWLARAIRLSREEILKGGKIAASFRKQPILPRMAVRMVSAGEETGNLSGLLEKVADFYEARVDAALTTINALIEPIFIVMIGMFVLVFILALYLPIFSLAVKAKV